jgi:hypothetical protein
MAACGERALSSVDDTSQAWISCSIQAGCTRFSATPSDHDPFAATAGCPVSGIRNINSAVNPAQSILECHPEGVPACRDGSKDLQFSFRFYAPTLHYVPGS